MRKTRLLWIPLCLSACDKAKNLMDPTGRSYGKSATASGGATTSTTASATPAAAAPAPATSAAVPARLPALGRNLTARDALGQVPSIRFQDERGSWNFRDGIARRGAAVASVLDSAGKPWGIAAGDLDLDGSDDAVVLVRLDKNGAEPVWKLANLRTQGGTLFNTQTIVLPGHGGYRDVAIQGNAAVLVPEIAGPAVRVSYSGGRLSIGPP